MLPSGVTVQDEHGNFLLVNDAAAELIRMAAAEQAMLPSKELDHRRKTCLELLRTGRSAVSEESISSGQ